MGLSLEGFGEEFEIGKIAFELKDLKKDGGKNIRGIFCGEAQRKQEKSNCNQGRPGMLLITLEILTHVRFLRVFVYDYLMYC